MLSARLDISDARQCQSRENAYISSGGFGERGGDFLAGAR